MNTYMVFYQVGYKVRHKKVLAKNQSEALRKAKVKAIDCWEVNSEKEQKV